MHGMGKASPEERHSLGVAVLWCASTGSSLPYRSLGAVLVSLCIAGRGWMPDIRSHGCLLVAHDTVQLGPYAAAPHKLPGSAVLQL